MTSRIVHGACPHDCPDTCALAVHVQGEQVIKVQGRADHPNTHGALCTKVSRYLERTYHPDRLLYPMKRIGKKGEGKFERISWDEALDIVSKEITRQKTVHGNGSDFIPMDKRLDA